MIDTDKEYTLEDVLAMFPEETEKTCIIDTFLRSLEFIKTAKEFKTVDMQRYLRCGYGDTCRVIDALLLLGAIEKIEETAAKYKVKFTNRAIMMKNKFNEYIPAFLMKDATESELLGGHVKLDGSNLISICSRPGMGKTALALNLALNFARKNKKCVYIFSYEMLEEHVRVRLLSLLSGLAINVIKNGDYSDEELNAIRASEETLKSLNIIIDDEIYSGISNMEERLSQVENLGMVIVDYLGLMISRDEEYSQGAFKNAVLGMKAISEKFGIPVIFTQQLSKRVEYRENKKPNISDIEDYVSNNADTVILLYREDY